MTESTKARRELARVAGWCLAALAIAGVYGLSLANPGYFSHDELEWGARAAGRGFAELTWTDWTDFSAFQYRPLTFNLWLALSWFAFESPTLMHALWIVMGAAVCAGVFVVLRRLRATLQVALAGTFGFALNPFAVYVHGWVATLGDLLWVGAALAMASVVLGRARDSIHVPFLAGLAGTVIALLAKEAALALLPLLALAWAMSGRQRRFSAAFVGAAIPTAIYLALRLPLLLFAPRPGGAYSWSLAAVPDRLWEAHAWPYLVTALEFSSLHHAGVLRLTLAFAIAAALAWSLWSTRWPLAVAYLLGGALALGPALLLEAGYPQYGYGYSALACICVALAWPRSRQAARAAIALTLVLSCWHGVNVQRSMVRIGALQAEFSPSLTSAAAPGDAVLLYLEVPGDVHVYRRLIVAETLKSPERRIELTSIRHRATHSVLANGRLESRQPAVEGSA